jgi:hypothetical protein
VLSEINNRPQGRAYSPIDARLILNIRWLAIFRPACRAALHLFHRQAGNSYWAGIVRHRSLGGDECLADAPHHRYPPQG